MPSASEEEILTYIEKHRRQTEGCRNNITPFCVANFLLLVFLRHLNVEVFSEFYTDRKLMYM
jgi:hypothetical protein